MRYPAVCCAVVAALHIAFTAAAHADIRWTQDEDGRQTVFVADGARWSFGEPAYLRVNINANAAGRSEWLRWNTAASELPTAIVNRQTGLRFRYQSVLDYFDEDPAKRGARRKGDVISLETSKGKTEAVAFDLSYEGYDRQCLFFKIEDSAVRELTKGHLCDETAGATPIGSLKTFIDALEFRSE